MSAYVSGAGQSPISGNSFERRALSFTIQLGTGSFGNSGFNTVTLSGLRARASITQMGAPGFGLASAQIYGVDPSVMNQLSTLGVPLPLTTGRNNLVTISAGNKGGVLSPIFHGTTSNAWQNFDGMPDTFFDIEAIAAAYDAMAPVAPLSFPGQVDVATIMASLAMQMNRAFENNGVQVQLPSSYFPGTVVDQAQAVCRNAGVNMHDDGQTISIWPRNGTRGGAIPLIQPGAGLVGYPKYTGAGVKFTTLFNPSIKFGGQVNLLSSIPGACGIWYVNELSYELSCELPDGPWFCNVGAARMDGVPAA